MTDTTKQTEMMSQEEIEQMVLEHGSKSDPFWIWPEAFNRLCATALRAHDIRDEALEEAACHIEQNSTVENWYRAHLHASQIRSLKGKP